MQLQNSTTFYTDGTISLLSSCMYALGDAQCTLERFDLNYLEDGEMRTYLNVVRRQLEQVQNLLQLTEKFAEISKVEDK